MIGNVLIAGNIWIFLASIESPASVKVDICVSSMVIPSGSMAAMVFPYLSGSIWFDAVLAKFMLATESDIDRLVLNE